MMLRTLILISLTTLLISCDDDLASSEIPSVVVNTFKSRFPDAQDIDWESYGEDFEVDFEIGPTDYSALIDASGNMISYKYEIATDSLPAPIISVLNGEYSHKEWEDPEILISGKNRFYHIEIDGFFQDKDIVLDSNGRKVETIKNWK